MCLSLSVVYNYGNSVTTLGFSVKRLILVEVSVDQKVNFQTYRAEQKILLCEFFFFFSMRNPFLRLSLLTHKVTYLSTVHVSSHCKLFLCGNCVLIISVLLCLEEGGRWAESGEQQSSFKKQLLVKYWHPQLLYIQEAKESINMKTELFSPSRRIFFSDIS